MDFFVISSRETKSGFELYPDFVVGRSKDLMIQGHQVYAIWDAAAGLWSTDEYDVQRLVDEELSAAEKTKDSVVSVKKMRSSNSGSWAKFKAHLKNLADDFHPLNNNLTFANDVVKKTDYVSKRLPYSLVEGPHAAWDELLATLYNEEEAAKIEWAIGAVVSGDSKNIQKFVVFYGPPGTGKSTIMNIILKLFEGYTTSFEAKALGSSNGQFATDVFKDNPLVAIQQDGDLSRIDDNTRLNSIISHEEMTMNEKFKPSYSARVNAFLFMGTNLPVKISDAKAGIIRRLLDVHPTGVKIPANHYNALMTQVEFELGAIAHHCLAVYRRMGKNYYNSYRPTEMMLRTDVFFNFIEANFDTFKSQEFVTLQQAYNLYKEFCSDSGVERVLPRHQVREELSNYFETFEERRQSGGHWLRSCYSGFTADKFKVKEKDEPTFSLVLEETASLFDADFAMLPAQYAKADGTPEKTWRGVHTSLADLDTTKLHYVKLPENHLVIDFDLRDETGKKSRELNLRAASDWPPTYAEFSKSGAGIHLHYTYPDDPTLLSNVYSEGIEIKTFPGNSSLRRQLTLANNVPIALITGGLPFKEKKVQTEQTIQGEKGLRELIARNLRKEIHPGTKSSVDFILKILDDAYNSGLTYDVTDLRPKILAFANNSTNQSLVALKQVMQMKFVGKTNLEDVAKTTLPGTDERNVLFDIEVYPNLFVVCWKFEGANEHVKMINPSAAQVEALFQLRLIGFNNRRYDNHILYAASMGYTNQALYELSKKIIDSDRSNNGSLFGAAYELSYADIYDFSSKKQGLKKWEIELGILHMELDLPWDEPVADKDIPRVVEYCCNDVDATEVLLKHLAEDFVARKILAEISGLSVNSSTQQHTTKIVFGNERNPQKFFEYTDLSKEFPGYKFEKGVSTYRDAKINEGGYVYAEPGMYNNVAVLDIASMHPSTIQILNVFGDYTKNFTQLKDARVAIKRGDYAAARKMLDGKLAPFLVDESQGKKLAYALKIVINIVYGLTSAKFPNAFRDSRNVDNIVAKRGSLFMVDLQEAFKAEFGAWVNIVHIKTDSVKIPEASPEMIKFVVDFGAKYGYEFEHEATYDRFCLVNDAVYIARENGVWTATGAQFAHPYVFKKLFSHEEITLDDYFENKSVVKGTMYLDFDHEKAAVLSTGSMVHIGRTGQFIPVLEGGGVLYRMQPGDDGEPKYYAVTGTKGHLWMEATMAKQQENLKIDMSYFENLKDKAYETIDFFGSFMDFIS